MGQLIPPGLRKAMRASTSQPIKKVPQRPLYLGTQPESREPAMSNNIGPTRKKIVDARIASLLDTRRFCYVCPESGFVEGKGYRVSIAIENESGHFPTGNTPEGGDIEPWFWGDNFEEAREMADRENKERLGLEPIDAWKIVLSTMGGRPPTASQKSMAARSKQSAKR